MPHKEKDLNIIILQTHTNATQVQTDIKTVFEQNIEKAQVDFQKSASSDLIVLVKVI